MSTISNNHQIVAPASKVTKSHFDILPGVDVADQAQQLVAEEIRQTITGIKSANFGLVVRPNIEYGYHVFGSKVVVAQVGQSVLENEERKYHNTEIVFATPDNKNTEPRWSKKLGPELLSVDSPKPRAYGPDFDLTIQGKTRASEDLTRVFGLAQFPSGTYPDAIPMTHLAELAQVDVDAFAPKYPDLQPVLKTIKSFEFPLQSPPADTPISVHIQSNIRMKEDVPMSEGGIPLLIRSSIRLLIGDTLLAQLKVSAGCMTRKEFAEMLASQ